VVSGGFPCQDVSVLSPSGDGLEGERSGLWREMARVIGEVGPRDILVENSPALTARGLGGVLGDMAAMGYDARWGVLGADDAGGPHGRDRIWIAGRRMWSEIQTADDCELCDCCDEPFCKHHGEHYSDCDCVGPHNADELGIRLVEGPNGLVANAAGGRLERRDGDGPQQDREAENRSVSTLVQGCAWPDVSNPRTFGSGDVVAHRVDRLRAIGNGQVPAVAALAWRLLSGRT
jgi:DNA (cytosine-5)-methyltransferase 1